MHVAWQSQYQRHPSDMLRGQDADFLRGVAFWRFAKMNLQDRCGTSYDLA